MGYITHFYGEITITPPIPWAAIKDSPHLQDAARKANRDAMLRVEEFKRETDDGVLTVRQAVAVVPTYEDEMRGYNIVQHVQDIVDAFPDYEFGERLDCEGENNDDMWRLKVVNRKATKFKAIITWPEESE